MTRVFLLDNYDSFTYNIAQMLGVEHYPFLVRRAHETSLDEIEAFLLESSGKVDNRNGENSRTILRQDLEDSRNVGGRNISDQEGRGLSHSERISSKEWHGIIISPGPMRPEQHPFIFKLLERFHRSTDILGICLGMQAINLFFSGTLKRDPSPMHGKTSLIRHTGEGLFGGVRNPIRAARYHSLILDRIPDPLKVTAFSEEGIPMAFQHQKYPIFGIQFHPESFMTVQGDKILQNFLRGKRDDL